MTSTRWPAAASAVARLIAVVVLPTPPFWLASATMRARRAAGTARGSASSLARLTGNLLQAKNDPPPVGQALFDRHSHCPGFAGQGQFLLEPLAFGKQAERVGREKWRGQIEQAGRAARRRERSRHRRDAAAPPRCGMAESSTSAPATRAASRRKADLRESASISSTPGTPRIASTRPGKPGAAAEIDQACAPARDKR